MRKLFTLTAAILASFTLMAQTITLSAVTPESNWYGADGVGRVTNKSGNGWSSPDMTCDGSTGYKTGSSYFTVQTYQDISALKIWARSTSNRTIGKIYVSEDLKSSAQSASNVEYTTENENSDDYAIAKNACDNEFTITFKDVVEADNYIQIVLSGNADIVAVTFVAGSVVPSTDPVTTVTVSGPTSAYVGRELTFTATTDVKADTIYWTVDGTVVEGEHTKTLKFTPEYERTYNIGAWAKNSNNSDWVVGNISVVATVKPVLSQVLIDETTVWDFTKAAAVNEIKWEGAQKDADPVLLANVDDFNNDANFNSQALLFSGEYPIRDGKYCQGQSLAFNTTVAGTLEVVYSNTGNRSNESERRFLTINGSLVAGDAGSMKSSENTTTSNIPVTVGDVVISGAFADGTPQYLRIYKVTFTKEEPAAGCDWDNLAWIGNGSGNTDYTECFKVCVGDPAPTEVVNIQTPGFATAPGIYITFPSAAFTEISLAEGQYDVQGAGIVFHCTAFNLRETEVSLKVDGTLYTFTVYNAKGVTTAIENNAVVEKAVKFIENGQLFIEKNGVRYNAQGAIVK